MLLSFLYLNNFMTIAGRLYIALTFLYSPAVFHSFDEGMVGMNKHTRRIVRVTKSGRLFCNYCGRWNRVHAGMVNPICGYCKNPLG